MTMFERLEKPPSYQLLADSEAVARKAAQRILTAAQQAIASHGQFKLVLAGGSTPQVAYRLLADAAADWPHWHIYFGDERCLPSDDHERNSHMAFEAWLNRVPIPPEQIHPIAAEQGAERAAAAYHALVDEVIPFDMVLLGMGEDGHTASLFPGHQHDTDGWAVPVHNAPKPPPTRVSLSAQALAQTAALLVMVTGAGKHDALQRWSNGEAIPLATIQPDCAIELLLDKAAAGV